MVEGKVKPALNLLSPTSRENLLSLNQPVDLQSLSLGFVRDTLYQKHPSTGVINPTAMEKLPPNHHPHHVIFNAINGDLIKKMALKCQGAAGPSGIDAAGSLFILQGGLVKSASLTCTRGSSAMFSFCGL